MQNRQRLNFRTQIAAQVVREELLKKARIPDNKTTNEIERGGAAKVLGGMVERFEQTHEIDK